MLHIQPAAKISLERGWYFVIHGTRFGLTRDNEKMYDNDMRQVFTTLSAGWRQEVIISFYLNSMLMQTRLH